MKTVAMKEWNAGKVYEYIIAVSSALVALLIRAALDPLLGDHLPYVTFFVAVAVTTFYAGPGASLAATTGTTGG